MKKMVVMVVFLISGLSFTECTFKKFKKIPFDFEPVLNHFKKKLFHPILEKFHHHKPHQPQPHQEHQYGGYPVGGYPIGGYPIGGYPIEHEEPIGFHGIDHDFDQGYGHGYGFNYGYDHGFDHDFHDLGFEGYNGLHGFEPYSYGYDHSHGYF